MGAKGKSRRHTRKGVIRSLETEYDFARLDYKRLTHPGKGKSKLVGVAAASVVYLLGFSAAYSGWSSGIVPDETFAKIVWILMVPASVVGGVTWMIIDSRLEYPVRRTMAEYVEDLESKGGLLWRYGPLLELIKVKRVNITGAIESSREGRGSEIDPQDYAAILNTLRKELTSNEGLPITGEISKRLEENLDGC